ncbi:MAG: RiPP maturation radical SAM protein 1 [Desulfobulbus sp.]|nr:MAG: RiPP maturation radical SAM protein 1 [Desulfobulbus sp.]
MRVILASMPWAIFHRPSIQLAALKGYLQAMDKSISVTASHPCLAAAGAIGTEAYRLLSEHCWAGEALYSSLLFPEQRERAMRVFRRDLGPGTLRRLPDFDRLAGQLDEQLDVWLAGLSTVDYDLVGFSVCFSQLPATLLAAHRLKQRRPDLPVVLGGSTCAPAIASSLLAVFPQIDFIITGEGEIPLLSLCRFLAGKDPEPDARVLTRSRPARETADQPCSATVAGQIKDLDSLPIPPYEDYFTELRQSGLNFIPELPLEFSRGCWWNRCAFCNLNLQWQGFRRKSSERMLKEVAELRRNYRCLDFCFTDNSLPVAEAQRFFAETAKQDADLSFFGEIRILKNPEAYARYRQGGLRSVQIGIEALADSLLTKINKGTSVMDNVAAMKYCQAAGIRLDGNLIVEFPSSTSEEVAETLRVLDFVLPFRPLAAASFFLGHGSPVWQRPADFGLTGRGQHPWNRDLYPREVLARLSMLIDTGKGGRGRQRDLWQPVRKKMREWSAFHRQRSEQGPALSYRDGGDFLIIRQERPGQPVLHHRLHGLSRELYLACATPATKKDLLKKGKSITGQQLDAFLGDLEQKQLLFRHGDLSLALAVRVPKRP